MVINSEAKRSIKEAYFTLSLKLPVEDKKVKDRLDRAVEIINGYGYEVHKVQSDSWQVWKSSTSLLDDTSMCYDVSVKSCTCPDYETARAGLCKHRLAIMLIVEMNH
jgi:SWIM zinc finger